ncbi:hypothetical protein QQZ08_001764 [Neonectria magnoliae]|uniref:LTD domain-containing protein n=1 Tax=Neonectria magnoliae TaxID=2732573 RepID=A0ABR1IG34_9HYPO
MASRWSFTTEPGVFYELAELGHLYPGNKVATQPHLALIPGKEYPSDDASSPDQRDWVRFAAYVKWLNENSPDNVVYKVLYLTRHGFGYHNKKHAEVGTVEWDVQELKKRQSRVSFMNGDDKETWFDAHLTEVGIQQAHDLNTFWTNLIATDGAPLPQTLFTSPLARCLQTTQYIFGPLMEAHQRPFRPIVKELIRERMTLHTCDFRRPASWIRENYPAYALEPGFAEEDTFGRDGHAETDAEHVARKQKALEEVWDEDGCGAVVSLTVHSYAIRAIQEACGGRTCLTREGTSMAILVRGERSLEVILATVINPRGPDDGSTPEEVRLRNKSGADVSLAGWRIENRSGNAFRLPDDATLQANGGEATFKIHGVALTNKGGTIVLKNASGAVVDSVTYSEEQAEKEGEMVDFERDR